jgi:hypothetical protein
MVDVDRFDQMRSAGELLAQRAMERALDLVVQALDVNELVQQVDVGTLLSRIDVNALIEKVDVNSLLRQVDLETLVGQIDVEAMAAQVDLDALLSRVDVNRLIARVDAEAIAQHTEIGAVVIMSSRNVGREAVDIVRGQAVALDRLIDGWARRLLRRKDPGLAAPLNAGAGM